MHSIRIWAAVFLIAVMLSARVSAPAGAAPGHQSATGPSDCPADTTFVDNPSGPGGTCVPQSGTAPFCLAFPWCSSLFAPLFAAPPLVAPLPGYGVPGTIAAPQPPLPAPLLVPVRPAVQPPVPVSSLTGGQLPATVTISNTNPVTVTVHANEYLDLTHSVVINLTPGVTATGVQTSTGSATIVGGAVVWSGFALLPGGEATATIGLAANASTLVGVGAPSIQGVSITAVDQTGKQITFTAAGGGPTTDQLPASCSTTSGQTAMSCGGTRRFSPVVRMPRRQL